MCTVMGIVFPRPLPDSYHPVWIQLLSYFQVGSWLDTTMVPEADQQICPSDCRGCWWQLSPIQSGHINRKNICKTCFSACMPELSHPVYSGGTNLLYSEPLSKGKGQTLWCNPSTNPCTIHFNSPYTGSWPGNCSRNICAIHISHLEPF